MSLSPNENLCGCVSTEVEEDQLDSLLKQIGVLEISCKELDQYLSHVCPLSGKLILAHTL